MVDQLRVRTARASLRDDLTPPPAESAAPTTMVILGAGLAAALVALAFLSSTSVDQVVTAAGTWSEIAVTLLGAAACIVMVLFGERARAWGAASIVLFAIFTAFAGLSIVWSVQPDWSWFGANQLLSYLAVFAGAAALARTFPARWPGLVGRVGAQPARARGGQARLGRELE